MSTHSVVYAAFDRFPAPKGAATHIQAFVSALAVEFGNVELVTVAGPPVAQPAGPAGRLTNGECAEPNLVGVTHTELPALGASLVERVLSFRTHLRAWWTARRPAVAHVRSIFEGYPIARRKSLWCQKLVFEVNGLPSIELKYHYPQVADDRELMRKLLAQEQCCLDAADLIVTVSQVNAEYLRGRGVDTDRLRVIPNGVDISRFLYQPPRPWDQREIRLLYSGTLSSWQGVQAAIEALALYRREAPARLTVVGYGRAGQARKLAEWAHQLEVAGYVEFVDGVSQTQLARLHHEADAILVPLMPNDRNVVQGCCPLKVLEAMASGTPLVASDLPVVAALARPEVDAILVRPNSAKAIKDALLRLRCDPESAATRSCSARQRIESEFTWKLAQERLIEAYRRL
jgi:glycosyltransferase involved in cell wall biosynthesis